MNLKIGIYTFLFISWFDFSSAADSITIPQLIRDPETLISSNGNFELGFFSPSTSMNRYLGIWFNKMENSESSLEVIWVANRDNPILGSSSMFKLSEDGNLQVTDEKNNIFWSSNVSYRGQGSVAKLQDTGNLVLLPNGSNSVIWQSFDHPTDSLLPGAKITLQKSLNDTETKILSWISSTDPSSGRFRIVSLPQDLPEFFIVEGDRPCWRSGPWNGYLFLGVPQVHSEVSSGFNVDNHNDTLDLSYDVAKYDNAPLLERFFLTFDGVLTRKYWQDNKWGISWRSLQSECDVYGKCGKFAVCNPNKKPICECLTGFNPENIAEWKKGNWTNGCVRRMELQCRAPGSKEDKFLQLTHIKVPDYANWIFANQDNCNKNCLANCSCIAYSYYSGIGCMFWTANLIDLQQFSVDGADLFVRLAHSEVSDESRNGKIIVAAILILSALVSVISIFYLWKWMRHRNGKRTTPISKEEHWHKMFGASGTDLRFFDFTKLVEATDNFSDINKLGEGGFGPVYKGKWEDGEDIAVKRLSNMTGQGAEEFMNEVMVISKLQHKNLVRLLGCCVEGDEKLLVYELLPNKSLDAYIDPKQEKVLDWPTRFSIIQGICRGLLYLHRDSRLKIIHRDLKPSNILLDEELNPKISDFGMARIFGNKQDQASTLRIVGTYGYMSPEYAMQGTFSEKSDVFSLGVLLLEIVSGKKNHGFLDKESLNLLTYAWILWNENDIVSLINPDILDQSFQGQILKCIHVALLCVQEFPEDRPDVSTLIAMLDVDDVKTLPIPQSPGFTRSKGFSSEEFLQQVYDYSLTTSVSRSTASGP